jgi:hypothetical protein
VFAHDANRQLREIGGEPEVGKRCLVALDTDHIQQYVFATDKLKEIRGASSILDHLNRRVMQDIADDPAFQAKRVYTNGGSGLFLIAAGRSAAEQFGQLVQRAYQEETNGGASLTFAVEEIPDSVKDAWNDDLWDTLELLRFHLAEKKNTPPDDTIAYPSHPFLRVCDACGIRTSEQQDGRHRADNLGRELRYCSVCLKKRGEDGTVKKGINALIIRKKGGSILYDKPLPFAWEEVMRLLPDAYELPFDTDRPEDFDALGDSGSEKRYLALIYADGNGMGQKMGELRTLAEIAAVARAIDDAVYKAMSEAIRLHLQVAQDRQSPMFPFDILMIGGDDIMIATSASVAFDVACTLAKEFYTQAKEKAPAINCSLSIGVVLAPVKYPFGPLHDLAKSALKFAKKIGAKRQQTASAKGVAYGETLINFVTVTGSASPDFDQVYRSLHDARVQVAGRDHAFYATLRPYTVEDLEHLLKLIREGKEKGLGRTKLHQLREAVLRMNLSSSVYEGKAVLRNWRPVEQHDFVLHKVYALGNSHPTPQAASSEGKFQRVTFPWFVDGPGVYRTALLDYVELYDFVPQVAGGKER